MSRRFVALTQRQMTAWLTAPLDGQDIRMLVIDGIVFREYTVLSRSRASTPVLPLEWMRPAFPGLSA